MQKNSEKIKSGVPFVRFYSNDWYTGCAGLKADERGVYISMCVFIWATGKRVPLDDAEAARMLNLNFKSYQRVRDRLVVLGKVVRNDDGYGNERAERELQAAHGGQSTARRPKPDADERQEQDGTQADSGLRSEASKGTETDRAVLTDPMVDHVIDHGIEVEKTEQILRANKEPVPSNQERTPKAPTGAADDMPSHVKPMPSFAPVDENHGVTVTADGTVHLVNGTHAEWLAEFGGDERRLALALRQIQVQPASRTPVKSQVERQLARMAVEKLDRDKRYTAVAAANKPAPKPVRASRW